MHLPIQQIFVEHQFVYVSGIGEQNYPEVAAIWQESRRKKKNSLGLGRMRS